jgi:anti-sigma regulatory factor (Ser/Thr protein kinase)
MRVDDGGRTGEVRRAAVSLAATLRFDETQSGRVALIATEAATNLVRHGGGGDMMIRATNAGSGLEVLAIDRGPGMVDIERAMRDGYSTGGTPGTGLGAIRRLADTFDIYSRPGQGTALVAQVHAAPARDASNARPIEIGVVSLPKLGERVCGDGWTVDDRGDVCRLMVVDGLGHGDFAHEAAQRAAAVFRESSSTSPLEIIQRAHDALRGTRGAALAVAVIAREDAVVRFAGVGNVSGTIIARHRTHSLASFNGIVGLEIRKLQEFEAPWARDATIVLHSDGLGSRWRLEQHPGLLERHPALLAALLVRDCARGRDDATILVAREPRAPGGAP